MSAIPDKVDVIILGTGLVNSIIAAACSRIGKSVLHLDENSYYGSDWASFTFQQLIELIRSKHPDDASLKSIPEELTTKSRMFCLDLAPRFLYSNGDMVELLVKSNVARYHEFKNNIKILSCRGDEIHVMPCSRNEVFTSPLLPNLADKRRLMKFIELCLKCDATDQDGELIACSEKPIGQYLTDRGLDSTLKDFIINSIAMVDPETPTREACEKIKNFMVATERYGRSPFLFPLYGCGEFPQSFCRLSAVFGGLYCLNTQIKDVKVSSPDSPRTFSVIFSDEEHVVSGEMLVVEPSSVAKCQDMLSAKEHSRHYISRAIVITRKSIVPDSSDTISFMRIPPTNGLNSDLVFVIELNSSALVCPKDFCILYLWTKATSDDPKADLEATVKRISKDDTTFVAWSFYYRQLARLNETGDEERQEEHQAKLFLTGPSCDEIDYASAVSEARQIFARMCPNEEFLPRAPDPDEIVSEVL